MSLFATVESDCQKLLARLEKEGIRNLSDMDYQKYLRSTLWKNIREWILQRDNSQCVVCHVRKTKLCEVEVHHRSYEQAVLEGRDSDMLVTLCPSCHRLVEFYSDHSKRTCLKEKDVQLIKLMELHHEIECGGLPLSIDTVSPIKFNINYVGKRDFLAFYSLDSLIHHFAYHLKHKYRDILKIPMPFGREKLYQKTGIKISELSTGKEVINVRVSDGIHIVKAAKRCTLPVKDDFKQFVESQQYWFIKIQ